jgi:hypothetical protein
MSEPEPVGRPLPDALRSVDAAADAWREVAERLNRLLDRVERWMPNMPPVVATYTEDQHAED